MKSLVKSSLRGGAANALSTKPLLLENGVYYLAVQSTNAAKGGSSDYTVKIGNQSVFFTKGNNADDSLDHAASLGKVSAAGKKLVSDWVGYGDVYDYKAFTLQTGGKLSFRVSTTDAVNFSVLQNVGGKLKTLVKSSVKAGSTIDTKEVLVSAGTCYLAVQSTNAKKGGSADYTVSLTGQSVFFPKGDNTNDSLQQAAQQKAKSVGSAVSGWVGYGDASDYIKFTTGKAGRLTFGLNAATTEAYKAKQLKLNCFDASGKKVAVAWQGNLLATGKPVAAGIYYLGVDCGNVNKFNTSYKITTGLLAG